MQKDIGNYIVHSDGKVWSKRYNKFMNPCISNRYYLKTKIDGKNKTIHKLVAEAFLPNPNNLPEINHKSGIKTDNRVENLEWCTSSNNAKHAVDSGLRKYKKGSKHHLCKLTETQVLEIRESKGIPQDELAKKYGVGQTMISNIRNNKRRTHI
jgi:ribosome-binding protein aMBF1 (putative translation factor)